MDLSCLSFQDSRQEPTAGWLWLFGNRSPKTDPKIGFHPRKLDPDFSLSHEDYQTQIAGVIFQYEPVCPDRLLTFTETFIFGSKKCFGSDSFLGDFPDRVVSILGSLGGGMGHIQLSN